MIAEQVPLDFKAQAMQSLAKAYPNGMSSAQQHRDVIRNYWCGWMDCLMNRGDKGELNKLCVEHARMADPNWWPDNSWVWW